RRPESDLRRRELARMSVAGETVRRRAFEPNWAGRIALIALAIYVVYAGSLLGFTWDRFVVGLDQGGKFLGRMFPPNFERWDLLVRGVVESLQIAVIATFFGVLLALPIGFLAARNLMPPWVTWPARTLIALCR